MTQILLKFLQFKILKTIKVRPKKKKKWHDHLLVRTMLHRHTDIQTHTDTLNVQTLAHGIHTRAYTHQIDVQTTCTRTAHLDTTQTYTMTDRGMTSAVHKYNPTVANPHLSFKKHVFKMQPQTSCLSSTPTSTSQPCTPLPPKKQTNTLTHTHNLRITDLRLSPLPSTPELV